MKKIRKIIAVITLLSLVACGGDKYYDGKNFKAEANGLDVLTLATEEMLSVESDANDTFGYWVNAEGNNFLFENGIGFGDSIDDVRNAFGKESVKEFEEGSYLLSETAGNATMQGVRVGDQYLLYKFKYNDYKGCEYFIFQDNRLVVTVAIMCNTKFDVESFQ